MAREEDFSSDHFDWLVEARSRNQKSTAALYKIIERSAVVLESDLFLQDEAQELTAIAFSLWRAVFLSDLTGELGHQLADLRRFLRSLIAHNTVLYQTDFTSREWAFRYYLQNAMLRLRHRTAATAPPSPFQESRTAKDDWTSAQEMLETAISKFDMALRQHEAD